MEPTEREIEQGLILARKSAYRLAPIGADYAGLGVDDLTSVGMIAAVAALRTFEPNRGASLSTWVILKVRGAIGEEIRVAARHRARLPIERIADVDPEKLVDESLDPEAAAVYHEMLREVRRAVAGLPDRERETVRMRYWQDLTYKQIGARLGVTESRAHQVHTRALMRLRSLIER